MPVQPTRFTALERADFQRLEHAGYLKGPLRPFKGKGSLVAWISQCLALHDSLIILAQRRVVPQATAYPFDLLDVQLAQQTTGSGSTFLRWRNLDRSSMGVALWESLLGRPPIPDSLIDDLYAMELQRIAQNMQIMPDPAASPATPRSGRRWSAPRCRTSQFQRGMRVLVAVRTVRDEGKDANENRKSASPSDQGLLRVGACLTGAMRATPPHICVAP